MSSVTDYEKCPQCGGIYVVDFNCRTYEEYRFCHRCGKTEEYSMIRDANDNPVLDEKGLPKYESKENDGYGSIRIAGKKGISTCYSFNEPFDLDELKKDYLKTLESPDVDEEKSYLICWDAEEKKIVVIFGDDPGLYQEFVESINKNEAPF